MNQLLFAIAALMLSTISFAGGGSLEYEGLAQNKSDGFSFPELFIGDIYTDVMLIEMSSFNLRSLSSEYDPSRNVTGCVVLIVHKIPSVLTCGAKVSNPALSGVIYAFTNKEKVKGSIQLKCIYRCSPQIPQYFKLMGDGDGED